MAQSHPQSHGFDSLSLGLRETDTAAPAPAWELEELIDETAEPGQQRTRTSGLGGGRPRRGQRGERRRRAWGVGGELTARRQRSLGGDAWRRLIRNKLAIIGLVIVAVF